MEFTTLFGLHSQTTRLFESASWATGSATDGVLTLYDVLFQATWTQPVSPRRRFYKLQFGVASHADFKFELIPLHSPLLRESLLVSFPPLINMLKFSG